MFFSSYLFAALSVTTSFVHARAVAEKRDTDTVVDIGTLYAYATNITGFRLFYGDDVAYIGIDGVRPQHASVVTNVTFSEVDDQLIATPTNTSLVSSGNWTTPRLFIDQSAGAFATAGFTSAANTSVTTTGFKRFGTLLTWQSTTGLLESKWYAVPANQDGLFYLKWNVDNVIEDDAVSVALKNLAPSMT